VGDHERGARLRAGIGNSGVAQGAHVVDHGRPGGQSRARDRRAPGVDGHRQAVGRQPLHERHHARDLLVDRHGLAVGAAGLAAHVHDRRPGVHQLVRPRDERE
jgi:hypothetical protein